MNFGKLLESEIWPLIRKAVPGIVKTTVPGLPGVWFNVPDSSVCICVSETTEGEFRVTGSMSNIYVENDSTIVSNPEDIVDVISEKYDEWLAIPRAGRTDTRAAELEAELGTLTGIDLQAALQDEDPETVVFDDAVDVIPARLITLK